MSGSMLRYRGHSPGLIRGAIRASLKAGPPGTSTPRSIRRTGRAGWQVLTAAHVSPATVARRLRRPEFRAELVAVRAGAVERAVARLTMASVAAASELLRLATAPHRSPAQVSDQRRV